MSAPVVDAKPAEAAVPARTETTAGNYFVSNYPPFGAWRTDAVGELEAVLEQPPRPGVPLGLYTHIPFCRKRCHFCYFRVYTDKNADDIRAYIDAVLAELAMYASRPAIRGGGRSSCTSAAARPATCRRTSLGCCRRA